MFVCVSVCEGVESNNRNGRPRNNGVRGGPRDEMLVSGFKARRDFWFFF